MTVAAGELEPSNAVPAPVEFVPLNLGLPVIVRSPVARAIDNRSAVFDPASVELAILKLPASQYAKNPVSAVVVSTIQISGVADVIFESPVERIPPVTPKNDVEHVSPTPGTRNEVTPAPPSVTSSVADADDGTASYPIIVHLAPVVIAPTPPGP